MPALEPTDHYATITWLGRVRDRDAKLSSDPVDTLELTFAGVEGEVHSGLTRPSCSRVLSQYPRDTTIRNVRQLSILSSEELEEIAAGMGLDRLEPRFVGASLVIAGIADFTRVPPASRLQSESGTTLTIDMENRSCNLPGREIEAAHPGVGRAFKAAAAGRRGVTAWVEREGQLVLGERMRLHVPSQRGWVPAP
jgi:hypothetical protein